MTKHGDYSIGQIQAYAVNRYLEALEANANGNRGGGPTMRLRLERVDKRLAGTDLSMSQRVELVQKRLDYQRALGSSSETSMSELEAKFVEHCLGFSERKHISYAAWRSMGVPVRVLRDAGYKVAVGRQPGTVMTQPADPAEASAEPTKARRGKGSTETA